ncbi:MFS transporter [Stackebrandtia nassauensis]|uniref:Major facilitator superfamily MFS_1 n=1 Tax=Stackebrandtia nassauensis (strain DSM 44728 / CIP 108903 / NRRL B-16338 / NBRC 102104 / LLR-40K-21) TaxID=446470 RepID=D3QAU7_STANL|nr:MFS transporter [Stackebrandtia nassauensis]ADD44743.1 major facilitator superfamily MFS_1 [Stackebrandtia nassauensis DSM 44728]
MTAPAAVTATSTADGGAARRGPMLATLLIAWFMAQFDFFVVNVAAPSLSHNLNVTPAALELVVGGYAFTYAAGMITGGRLGDRLGHRRMFVYGMAAFTLASVLCGLAMNPGQLIAFRLLQGLTGAAMVPQVLALITATFPVAERPKALGWYALTGGLASISGQVLGGLLVDVNLFGLEWRTIFLINLPIGLLTVPLALKLLPRHTPGARIGLDPVGAIGMALTLGAVLVPLGLGNSQHWPLWTWLSLGAAVPLAVFTVWWQRRLHRGGGQPVLELALFKVKTYAAGMAAGAAFMVYWAGFMFTLALLLQSGYEFTAFQAGLCFLPMGVLFSTAALAGGRLVRRFGLRVPLTGSIIVLIGLLVAIAAMWTSTDAANLPLLIVGFSIMGTGNGLLLPQLVSASLTEVRREQAGIGAGMVATSQQFAQAAGAAILGAVFFAVVHNREGLAAYDTAMERVLYIDLGLLAVVASLVIYLHRHAKL